MSRASFHGPTDVRAIGSNYPYLEQVAVVPKMFEQLRFNMTISILLTNSTVTDLKLSEIRILLFFDYLH